MRTVENREQGCSRKKYSSEPKRDFTEEGEILYPPHRPISRLRVEAAPALYCQESCLWGVRMEHRLG